MIIKRLSAIRGRPTWSSLQGTRLQRRMYSEGVDPKPRSAHAQWYRDMVPAMVPIFLLGSAVYLGLQLTQQLLSHQKLIQVTSASVKLLQAEVDALMQEKGVNQTTGTPEAAVDNTKRST